MELQETEARVNVTWSGNNGDMPEPVEFDASEANVRRWVTEAIQNGTIPGIPADPEVDLSNFVIERLAATEVRPFNQVLVRPKVSFG